MNTKIIKLDINRRLYDKIVAKQDDTKSRFLLFQLLDGAVPFNLTDRSVRVYGVKPDGSVIFNDLTVTHSATGFCLLELTNQMLAIAGTVKLEIMITEGDKKLTSIPFEMEVIKKINSNAAVESSNEFRTLLNALKEIDDWNREFADKSGKLEELYTPRLNELGSQLDNKANKNNEFLLRLLAGDIKKIKFIGDSITAGAQCKGYNVPANGRVILQNSRFNDGGTGYARETGTDWNTFPSWVNLFRKYIKTAYPNIDVFNAGIGGLSLSETITYVQKPENHLIEADDDVIFLMLGTNDRRLDYAEFKSNLEWLVNYLKERCKTLILMSTPPTISEYGGTGKNYDTWVYEGTYLPEYNFGCREINMCYQKMADKYGLTFINNFVKSNEYMAKTNSAFYDINSDRTHPNTLGHKVIWNNIQEELGLVGQVSDFKGDGLVKMNTVSFDNFQIFSKLPIGTSITSMLTGQAQGIGLPTAGTVITIKPIGDVGYEKWTTQYYLRYSTGAIKYRAYSGDGAIDSWTAWSDVGSGGSNVSTVSYGNVGILSTDLTKLNKGVTIGYITNTEGLNNNFPLGKGGMVVTYKPADSNDGYIHQVFYPFNVNRQYVRTYTGSVWSAWSTDRLITIAQTAYLVTMSTLLTDSKFEEGINYHYMVSSEPDVPENKAGTLITHKPVNALIGYGYQEYHIYGNTTIYKRIWQTSTWGSWIKITP